MTSPSLLLLIPAYNEERRIEPVLRAYASYFERQYQGKFELLVVMNGCRDNTLGVVQRVAKEFPSIKWLEFKDPIGKGGALIEGLRAETAAELIGYVDADGATPPHAFLDLINRIGGYDCVIGSRWLPGAVLHQEQSGKRQFASRVFHFIVQMLFWMNIRDTQCGAKVIRRAAVEKIHSSLRIADMAFDINLLYSLKRAGYRILEVPTEWTDQIGSKVVLGSTSLTMLLSAIRIRLIYWPWLYQLLRPLKPLEIWIYKKLRQPTPLSGPDSVQGPKSKV
ncbi:MAG TPA: dolichyl-phosphate beta-glucosyltransferase [Candidatus Polarisedimenticolia bacterium]|nr:dolichyl-phosphate beta-glucosyltransferase [Candidatus Polarisedimenticolia bacterium]